MFHAILVARSWREDPRFPAPNRYHWRVKTTIDYRKINGLLLAAALAKVGVEGSNPFARSRLLGDFAGAVGTRLNGG
jgi:hypothetical protein